MRKAIVALLFLLLPLQASAAIAFDAIAPKGDTGGTASSLTITHTVTGSNPILIVGCVNVSGNTDAITGITYNSVAMTRIETKAMPDEPAFAFLYALAAPATGAHDVVVSISPNQRIECYAESFTGASQTLPLDNHTNNYTASATALSATLTTVANNAWTVAFFRVSNTNTFTANSGSNLRSPSADGKSISMWDSNAAITPAGSTSLGMNTASAAGPIAILMASIAPASATAPFSYGLFWAPI